MDWAEAVRRDGPSVLAGYDGDLLELINTELIEDPFTVMDWLRDSSPVYPSGVGPMFLRHADCNAVLRHQGFGRGAFPEVPMETIRILMRNFLMLDPPDHTRLRGIVAPFFTPAAIGAMRPRVENVAAGILDGLAGRDEIDIVVD